MNPSVSHDFQKLSDRELVRLLVEDPIQRIEVVKFLHQEHQQLLMRVAIAIFRQSWKNQTTHDSDELASIVNESLAELLHHGARPTPSFKSCADGLPDSHIDLVPYLKAIVRNKVRQRFRELRKLSTLDELQEDHCVVYPDFEQRDDLARIAQIITNLALTDSELRVANVYRALFPQRPGFTDLKTAFPDKSDKAVRRLDERFLAKLRTSATSESLFAI